MPHAGMRFVLNEVNITPTEDMLYYKFNCLRHRARGCYLIKRFSDFSVSTAYGFIRMYGKHQGDVFDTALEDYYYVSCNRYFFIP